MQASNLELQIAFLKSRQIGNQKHSQSSLIKHLLGTHDILKSWDARPTLCTAGLFHSVYGTQSFNVESVDISERNLVRRLIGFESEEIAYLFSFRTRESFESNFEREKNFMIQHRQSLMWVDISAQIFADLCNLSAANWLEQLPRLPLEYHERGRHLCMNLLAYVMPDAKKALRRAYQTY